MLYNLFQNNPREDVLLQHISILLNTINNTFQLLHQQVSVYRQDVKNHKFLFYEPRDDFETRLLIISVIQKELKVYHYYKEITLKLLCKFFLFKRSSEELRVYHYYKNPFLNFLDKELKNINILMMSIFDSPPENENEQQITAHDFYYNSHLVEDNVSAGLLSFLYLLLMLLGLFALFEHEYQLYYVNTNNNTNDSFLRHNTNDSLI